MKKLITFLLILSLLLPVCSSSESAYAPKLNMTMQDFVTKYNMAGAPFGSPLIGLSAPHSWTVWEKYNVAWFKTDNKSTVTILLESEDPSPAAKTTASGVDRIQVFMVGTNDFLSFIAVSCRCLSLFATNMFGLDTAYYYVGQIIKEYYENNCFEQNLSYHRQLEVDGKIYIRFFYDSGYYYFEIVEVSEL